MGQFGRRTAAAERAAERRERENRSPRLADEIRDLVSLRLEIDEKSEIAAVSPRYVRRVVVANAPALFLVPCGDSACTDGGHDITPVVMRSLRAHATAFDGADPCHGSIGNGSCTRVMSFNAVAEYGPKAATALGVVRST